MSPQTIACIRNRRRAIARDLFPFESGEETTDHARELNRDRRIDELRAMILRRRI